MKFNIKGWKKHSQDANHTVLKNADGHELRIAHKALKPEHRRELQALESEKMADGGEVSKKAPESSSSPKIDPKKAKEVQEGATESGFQPKKWLSNVKEGLGYADGGEVDEGAPIEESASNPEVAPSADQSPAIPVGTMPQAPTQGIAADPRDLQGLEDKVIAEKEPALVPNAAQAMSQTLPTDQPKSEAQEDPFGVNGEQKMTQEGMAQQVQGLKGQAKAESEAATKAADIYKAKAKGEVDALSDIQKHYTDYQKEANAVIQDLKGSTIDPNHYWNSKSTGSKIATVIGLMLGGFNPSGHNSALEYMKSQINNDLEAQRANLAKKQNLFSALTQHYGNEQDASKMFLAIKNQGIIDQMEEAKAKAISPLAQATLDQNIGKLKLENAHTFAALAAKKAMLSPGSGQGGDAGHQQQDPAMFVPHVVPKEHQAKVFGEIKAAQDTKRMSKSILDAFDQASKENTVMRTAGGLRTPASVYALHQAMQPTFGDLEGTVRQAAMDNTFTNITPKPGDMESTVADKRKSLVHYLESKASAPTAKGFGIDLNKFDSTRPTQEGDTAVKTVNGVQYQKVAGGWARVK